jgi:hypothetical protein
MKKLKYSEERFMAILWDLYRKTTNGETIIQYGDFCRHHQVTNAMFPILVRHKVLHGEKLKDQGKGRRSSSYTWASIPPNIHMAKKLMDEIKKCSKEANDNYKERKLMEKQLLEIEQLPENNIVDMAQPQTINPIYEMQQTPNVPSQQQIYDVSIPVQQTNANMVTLSTDAPRVKNEASKQKSVSILWGLISIKW